MVDEIFAFSQSRSTGANYPGTMSLPDTDPQGNVIFRRPVQKPERVDPDLMKNRLASAIKVVREGLAQSGVSKAEVCLKFAADAKVGIVFLGETGLESSIEVKFEFDLAKQD